MHQLEAKKECTNIVHLAAHQLWAKLQFEFT